jgi:hypothetical protein
MRVESAPEVLAGVALRLRPLVRAEGRARYFGNGHFHRHRPELEGEAT